MSIAIKDYNALLHHIYPPSPYDPLVGLKRSLFLNQLILKPNFWLKVLNAKSEHAAYDGLRPYAKPVQEMLWSGEVATLHHIPQAKVLQNIKLEHLPFVSKNIKRPLL
jgi:hypothetical protein